MYSQSQAGPSSQPTPTTSRALRKKRPKTPGWSTTGDEVPFLNPSLLENGQVLLVPPDSQTGLTRKHGPERQPRSKGKRKQQPQSQSQSRPLSPTSSSAASSYSYGPHVPPADPTAVIDYTIPSRPRMRHIQSGPAAPTDPSRLHVEQHHGNDTFLSPPRPASQISDRSRARGGATSPAPRRRSRSRIRHHSPEVSTTSLTRSREAILAIDVDGDEDRPPPYTPPSPPVHPQAPSSTAATASVVTHRAHSSSAPPAAASPDATESPRIPDSPAASSSPSVSSPEPHDDASRFQAAWEEDREAGLSLEERIRRDFERRQVARPAAVYESSVEPILGTEVRPLLAEVDALRDSTAPVANARLDATSLTRADPVDVANAGDEPVASLQNHTPPPSNEAQVPSSTVSPPVTESGALRKRRQVANNPPSTPSVADEGSAVQIGAPSETADASRLALGDSDALHEFSAPVDAITPLAQADPAAETNASLPVASSRNPTGPLGDEVPIPSSLVGTSVAVHHRPLPLPPSPPTVTAGPRSRPTSAYISLFHTAPPTSVSSTSHADQHDVPPTTESTSADTRKTKSASHGLDAVVDAQNMSDTLPLRHSPSSVTEPVLFTNTNNAAQPSDSDHEAGPSQTTLAHPVLRLRPAPPSPPRSRLRSASNSTSPNLPPSSYIFNPSPFRNRPRSPILGSPSPPSTSTDAPPSVMDRVGAFEAMTTRRRPPPPPPPLRPVVRRPPPPPPLERAAAVPASDRSNSGIPEEASAVPNARAAGAQALNGSANIVLAGPDNASTSSALVTSLPSRPNPDHGIPDARHAAEPDTPSPLPASSNPQDTSSSERARIQEAMSDDRETAPVQSALPPSEPVPVASSSTSLPPQRQPSYEYTDLDLLVARLEDQDPSVASQGTAYDDLLIISDIIGPAADSVRDREHERAVEELPVAHVQVERRRITKDGRKKLKLSLMGVLVDRCSVCMSQFKNEELGVLLPCQHSFHPKCVETWLRQHLTCPLCRQSIINPE